MKQILILGLFLVLDFSGRALDASEANNASTVLDKRTVYLVSHGWHAGIVLRREDLFGKRWPIIDDFPHGEYLEIGWGDLEFYQNPEPGSWLMIRAVLQPTDSVLHVVGFEGEVTRYFPNSEVIRIELPLENFRRLSQTIAASFELDGEGRPLSLGPGLYGNSRFYRSRESYHLFNTCNVWVARILRTAGLPVNPALSLRVEGLLEQVRSSENDRSLVPQARSE